MNGLPPQPLPALLWGTLGDIRAVADSDGKLVDLALHPAVTTHYTHVGLAERMNTAFAALRAEVEEDYQARYGGELG